jgi:hypothetical protein
VRPHYSLVTRFIEQLLANSPEPVGYLPERALAHARLSRQRARAASPSRDLREGTCPWGMESRRTR